MKVLVTVGTEQFQFDRLMKAVERLAAGQAENQFVVQYGSSQYVPAGSNVEAFTLLPETRYRDVVRNSDVIMTHAGDGSLAMANQLEKPYLLVPRRAKLSEHVDDHQLELADLAGKHHVPTAVSPDVDWLCDELEGFTRQPRFQPFYIDKSRPCDRLRELTLGRRGKVMLVTSGGGHLDTMKAIRPFWDEFEARCWVTLNDTDLGDNSTATVYRGVGPTNRSLVKLCQNYARARRWIERERPDVVLSTGAAIAVAVMRAAKDVHPATQTIFVEAPTRVADLSLSAKLAIWMRCLDAGTCFHEPIAQQYGQFHLV
ncbi:glycosyltransferase [Crateriforma conspicua]|uniref:Undecaprenyldiphospho-muramoylpentapeptide beta-N-acetylglucosaminyltransferase n=1 Tax=Crateriforma conspicua TaxID=2527996 RepID=A0A5C5Y450_9PLAN|nr:glycosyltransferase [Crateriforma conspicua]TWT69738.1 undecaprenyldiphospho-muramoylpentapeptide beta-N- acetylglucosaminyltransferase [Crateriforma conspicua]